MLRPDEYVKVLDFGLAKLDNHNGPASSSAEDDQTRKLLYTSPGVVLGTASYMSPEQARWKGDRRAVGHFQLWSDDVRDTGRAGTLPGRDDDGRDLGHHA